MDAGVSEKNIIKNTSSHLNRTAAEEALRAENAKVRVCPTEVV